MIVKNNDDLITEIESENKTIYLKGLYRLFVNKAKSYFFDGKFLKYLIQFKEGNKIIDGSDADIEVNVDQTLEADLSIFSIFKNVKNLRFRNMRIFIRYNGGNSSKMICAIHNTSYRMNLLDCELTYYSESQINFIGIYNNGNLDTHLDTPADNLYVRGCRLSLVCKPQEINLECKLYGIYNDLANSISISENYIFVQLAGSGKAHQAIAIFNGGRFARIENNNIKANGTHSKGFQLEQAHAIGVYNIGVYMVFVGNNCIGEWGGRCIGILNEGNYAIISANKILATHTIMGRTVILNANSCIVSENVLTGTSRNPHIIEVSGEFHTINGNFLKGLLAPKEYRSGVGIFIQGTPENKTRKNKIFDNMISYIRDYGILAVDSECNTIKGNLIEKIEAVNDFIPIFAPQDYVAENNCEGIFQFENPEKNIKRNLDAAVRSI